MSSDNDVERFDNVKCVRETAKALLVQMPEQSDRELWIPKSVIHDDSEVYGDGHEGELVVARWFAEKEGLS